MKYMKGLGLAVQIGFALIAFLVALRAVCGLFAMMIPVLDAVFSWMYDHAIVGGLTLAITFIVLWFASECDRQREKEKIR